MAFNNDKTVKLLLPLQALEGAAINHCKTTRRLITYLYQGSMHQCLDTDAIAIQLEEIDDALDTLVAQSIELETLKSKLLNQPTS